MLMRWLRVEEFRQGARLCHGRSRRGEKTRRALGIAGAALTTLSLIGLSGCSGAADAVPTVGPTAGADESVEPAEYEPSLPPYTSEVDLSAEDEAEVEELLLLIDELSYYTSNITEENIVGLKGLEPRLSNEVFDEHIAALQNALDEGQSAEGVIEVSATQVTEFEDGRRVVVATCYDMSSHRVVSSASTDQSLHNEEVDEFAMDTVAEWRDSTWLISGRYKSRLGCNEI